jgi:hypothetical protein
MNAAEPERLSSSHLEDLAFIVLSARADDPNLELYPDLDADTRARLRSRLKQLARYDFPSSMSEDPSLRRGYTLRQCCRLTIALLLLDSHLPPSLVVMLARNNEVSFLRAIAGQLGDTRRDVSNDSDLLAVILPAEIQDTLAFPAWLRLEPDRVRLVRRCDLSLVWSNDLAGPGARLVVDIAAATGAMWRWISGRRLMTDVARTSLLEEVENEQGSGFSTAAERRFRR